MESPGELQDVLRTRHTAHEYVWRGVVGALLLGALSLRLVCLGQPSRLTHRLGEANSPLIRNI